MATPTFQDNLSHFQDKDFFQHLEIHRGIERESLRVNKDGSISQANHPKKLGSPLTNSDITTDFAEALVELVTPTYDSAESLFSHLSSLHHFLYAAMEDELLWNFSMPCAFKNAEEIRIAEYGHSNSGMLKHIYRKGLSLRYGSIMQCVSGIHFNFSISKDSWQTLEQNPTQEFIDEKYLGLIRNVKRNSWFLLDQFGASPVTNKSYLLNREHELEKYGAEDLFLPSATSLRMSEVGYQSSIQETLGINYNNLGEFINSVIQGINTSHPEFEALGLLDRKGEPQQISSGILQIENELYDIIRPKRTGASTSRPSNLLRRHGIEYIELRGVDVNPYVPEGISLNNIKVLDLFLMHALISDSPFVSIEESEAIRLNQAKMVRNGRSDDLELAHDGDLLSLSKIRKGFHEELSWLAAAMDDYSPGYSEALHQETNRTESLSEKIMNEMKESNMTFQEYGLSHSKKIADAFNQSSTKDLSIFTRNAEISLKELKILEETSSMDINKYVELYNSKLKEKK